MILVLLWAAATAAQAPLGPADIAGCWTLKPNADQVADYPRLAAQLLKAVWFAPLDAMSVTGVEAVLVVLFAGAALGHEPLRRSVDAHPGSWRALSLLSVGAAFVRRSLLVRCALLAVGVAADQLVLGVRLFDRAERRQRAVAGLLLAAAAQHLLRLRHRSELRSADGGALSVLLLVCGTLAAAWAGIERAASISVLEQHVAARRRAGAHSLAPAVATGGAVFLVALLGAAPSTVPRYAGVALHDYAASWPLPLPPVLLPTAGLLLGVALALTRPTAPRAPLWLASGAAAALAFVASVGFGAADERDAPALAVRRRMALFSGAWLVAFAVALWPALFAELARTPLLGRALGAVAAFVFSNQLIAIYVVAYKFCPGGWLLRESHAVMFVLCLGAIAWQYARGWRAPEADVQPFMLPDVAKRRAEGALESGDGDGAGTSARRPRREPLWLFGALVLWFAPSVWQRLEPPAVVVPADTGRVRMGLWTVHFGYDNWGASNFGALRDAIAATELDVVGLLETDLARPFFGNRDIVEYLADSLGMYSDYGPATADNTFGCALLSRYPIVRARRVVLASPDGELACLIDASVALGPRRNATVLVSHFGNTEDVLDRRLQTAAMAQLVRDAREPLVILSYLTSSPLGPTLLALRAAGAIDPLVNEPGHPWFTRYCQYILHTKRAELRKFVRLPDTNTSDTELQYADFFVQNVDL